MGAVPGAGRLDAGDDQLARLASERRLAGEKEHPVSGDLGVGVNRARVDLVIAGVEATDLVAFGGGRGRQRAVEGAEEPKDVVARAAAHGVGAEVALQPIVAASALRKSLPLPPISWSLPLSHLTSHAGKGKCMSPRARPT